MYPLIPIRTVVGCYRIIFMVCTFTFLFVDTLQGHGKPIPGTIKHFKVQDGLQSMINYDILQDDLGYIWIAGEAGISRYNGTEFKNYGLEEGLNYNQVVQIEKDLKGRVWMNTAGGLSYLENSEVKKLAIPNNTSLPLFWNYQVSSNLDSGIWINSNNSVKILNPESLDEQEIPLLDNEHESFRIIGSYQDETFVFEKGDVVGFRGTSETDRINIIGEEELSYSNRFNLTLDYPNVYFNSESNGLSVLNLETQQISIIDKNLTTVRKIYKQGKDLWVVPFRKGLYKYTLGKNNEVQDLNYYFDELLCTDICIDKTGNIWIPTYGFGVYFITTNQIEVNSTLLSCGENSPFFESMYYDDNTLVAGNMEGCVWINENGKQKKFALPSTSRSSINRVLDIEKLKTNHYLFATDAGIFSIDNGEILFHLNVAAKNIEVVGNQILINTYKNTLISSPELLAKAIHGARQEELMDKGILTIIDEGRSYASLIDTKGRLWIGNSDDGLVKYEDAIRTEFSTISPLFKSSVTDIAELSNGIIAIATNGEGVLLLKDEDFYRVTATDGLASNTVFDICVENDEIYAATNNGVSVINFEGFPNHNYKISTVTSRDGLTSNEIKAIEVNKNELLLASVNGIMKLNRNELFSAKKQQEVIIEQVAVNNHNVSGKRTINLNADENNIKIEFAAINFTSSNSLSYAYKMMGVDNQWITTSSNQTHYSNLVPGDYEFLVKVNDEHSITKSKISSLELSIKPFFYQTGIFKLLSLLVIFGTLGLFVFLIYTHKQRLRLQKIISVRTTELKERVRDLAESNKRLEESNKELEKFAYVTSHDLKTPLRSVGSFLQLFSLKNEGKFDEKDLDYLNYAESGVKKMEQIIHDLLAFSKVGATEQEPVHVYTKIIAMDALDSLAVIIRERNAEIVFDGKFPKLPVYDTQIYQVFQNLVSNALKYNQSEVPKIKIGVEEVNKKFIFTISDNGIGIDPKYSSKVFDIFKRLHSDNEYSGTGIGLAICKKIIEFHGGEIWFDSKKNEGCTFYFTIPIKEHIEVLKPAKKINHELVVASAS